MAQPQVPMINGHAYAWADIKFTLFGRIVRGITAINYGHSREKPNNYGQGSEPVSRGRGNKEYSGSITLELKEVKAILDAAGKGKSLTDIAPFDVDVVYENEYNLLINDKLQWVEFTDDMRDFSQGDGNTAVEINIKMGKVINNAA